MASLFFVFHLCFFFLRFVLAPSSQPNNSSTSTHKGAEPSSAQVSHDSHSPIHPPTHTHSRSVTLTLNTITCAFIHSLTYSPTHSFHSPSQSRNPSQTHRIHTPTCKPWCEERQQACDTCCWLAHVPCVIPNPQLPGELGNKQNMQAVHSANGRFLTTTDSPPSEAGINAIDSN